MYNLYGMESESAGRSAVSVQKHTPKSEDFGVRLPEDWVGALRTGVRSRTGSR